ncbi:MAG TPA: UrcA family protein [Allosphingosinicella sp.]|nr:UrcA family protein [Allosphingosinicella sp.]
MKTLVLAAVAAASLSAAPAIAQPGPTRIVISPAGLDLATAEGRAALDLRILHAARDACGTPSSADARGRAKAEECVTGLRAAAAEQRDVMIASAERRAQTTLASR